MKLGVILLLNDLLDFVCLEVATVSGFSLILSGIDSLPRFRKLFTRSKKVCYNAKFSMNLLRSDGFGRPR